jgi:integrating conjugative element protein (TIGR03749 family)
MSHPTHLRPITRSFRLALGLSAGLAACISLTAVAQVQDLSGVGAAPELLGTPSANAVTSPVTTMVTVPAAVKSAPMVGDFDLGQNMAETASGPTASASALGVAQKAAREAALETEQRGVPPTARKKVAGTAMPAHREGVERAVFARLPVRVGLPVKRERLITLPSPAVLHVPSDIEAVARVEAIDRTIYVTALVPFAPIRIVAELIEGGQQIPLDLVANAQTAAASQELEIFIERGRGASAEAQAAATADEAPAADMVELTRFASRMLYAPRRLAVAQPGVSQVQVSNRPVVGLVRGALVETVPMGQWRSAGLYVTAVRITNKSNQPMDIPLDNLRGKWLAVSAQHGRLGAAGSEADTSALYLICDRAFDACL